MTTVNGKLIGAEHPERVEMVATLVDVTGKAAVGYVASLAGELVRPVPIHPSTDGTWTASLTANTLITSQSGDTLWAVQEGRAKDGKPVLTYIAVPETGGPYWAGQILADLSSTQTGASTVLYLAGPSGTNGASAYAVAVANGFTGTQTEWLASLVGPQGAPGSGGGAVDSVNSLTGVVVLDAAAVGADPAGAASTAQSAAITAAATDATAKVAAHTSATDPHGDRAAAATALSAHESDTTAVHGITDTAALETASGAQAKADAAQTAATTAAASDATAKVAAHVAASDPHGDRAAASSALAAHAADTTDVHGITNTALLETATGAQAKADTAQSAATSAAATDATAKVSAHTSATDPHGDRAYADGKLSKTGGTLTGDLNLTGANLTIQRADNTGGYRFRVTGGALDLEIAGLDVIVSKWANPDFSGTQSNIMRWEAAGPHLIGRTQFGTGAFDAVHDIDSGTGVASLGAKNGLANIRLCGRRATAGAPTTGDWATADAVQDSAGVWWLCTAGGTPGTWTSPPAPPSSASTVTASSAFGQAASAGSAATYSRGDHVHGTPALTVGTTSGTVAAGDDSRITGAAQKAQNLADLASASAARTNLGLGGAATLAVGTAAGTVAAGDDSRITGAAQKASNLSDLASASTARTNLGLGGAALLNVGTAAGTVAAGDDSRITGALPASGGAISGNLAVAGNALGEDTPAGHGVASWCYDPALAVNSTQLTAGTLYLVRLNIAAAVNVTKIYWWVANTGSGATTNQNLVGLYDSSGTLLASANVDTGFSTATLKTTTIASTALSAGSWYWVGLLFNASVTPTLTRGSGWTGVDAAANLGLSAAQYRFAKNGTGRTSMPSSITPASNVGSDIAGPWVAVGA